MTPQEEESIFNQPDSEKDEDGSESFFARITRRLAAQVDLACGRCNEPFRGDPDGDGLCMRCSHYASVPGDAPGAFNWYQKHNDGSWTVRALWEDYRYVGEGRREDIQPQEPKAGDVVDVYRRDGSSSRQTIASVGDSFIGSGACRYLYCQVRPAAR